MIGEDGVSYSGAAEIYLFDLTADSESLLVEAQRREYTMKVGSEERRVIDRDVWMRPVVHGDFVVYEWERQIGSGIYAMRLAEK
jgi:hypothetical protein